MAHEGHLALVLAAIGLILSFIEEKKIKMSFVLQSATIGWLYAMVTTLPLVAYDVWGALFLVAIGAILSLINW